MTTINWPTVSVISTGSSGGITSFSSSQEGQVLFKGTSGDGSTAIFRDLVAGPNITLTSGTNSIEISGSGGGVTSLSSSQEGEILFRGVSGDGTTALFRDLIAGPNITLTSGSNLIEISGSPGETLPSANKGGMLMFSSTEWTTGSYLSKYVVGPDPTDRYSSLGDAIAAVVSDGANVSPINPAIIYVKPKLGTSDAYNVGNIVMPPNIVIQGLTYGASKGTPGAILNGTFTFQSSSFGNGFRNISIRTSSGNIINITNDAFVYLNSTDVRADGTATALNINNSNSRFEMDANSTLEGLGNQPVIKNAAGNFRCYGGKVIQNGTSIISYNSTGAYTVAYGMFLNSIIQGEIHFTKNGAAHVANCIQSLTSNSAYPVEFDNAGSGATAGGMVYNNSSIYYNSGLSGPSGPWINVIAGTADLYVGNVALHETNLRTLNPYTDNVNIKITKSEAENSASWLRRTWMSDVDPTDRQIIRFYDNGASQNQAQWQDEEPSEINANSTISLSDTSTTRHLICTNSGTRSVTFFNANVRPGSFTVIDGAGTASSAPISVTGSGVQTINGDRTITSNYGAATFVSDGSAIWYRIS